MNEQATRNALKAALKIAQAKSYIGLSSSVSKGTVPSRNLAKIELQNCKAVCGFVEQYLGDPIRRLYDHQWSFLESFSRSPSAIQMITSETGSGKSLCLWSWIISIIGSGSSLEDGTALAIFPYKALLYNQAFRLADLSVPGSVRRLTERNLRENGYRLKKELKKIGFSTDQIKKSCNDGIPYAGTLTLPGEIQIPWVVWEGSKAQFGQKPTLSDFIANKPDFGKARIRLATLVSRT